MCIRDSSHSLRRPVRSDRGAKMSISVSLQAERRIAEGPMWNLAIPLWEFVLRAAVVYAFLLVLLRLTGKRQIGQLAPFDLVLLLVLSNAVQNSMNGGDNSCLLYTSDAADERSSVDLGGR